MSRTWSYTLNAPADWLNINQRHKRRPDVTIAAWRNLSSALAHYCQIPQLGQARVTAELHWADRRRRDSSNYMPTIKAAIDGLIDARVLTDDDDEHLVELTIRRGESAERRKLGVQGALTLIVTEVA